MIHHYRVLAGFLFSCLILLILKRTVNVLRPNGEETPQTFTYIPRSRSNIARFSHLDKAALLDYAIPRLLDHLTDTDVLEISRRARLFAKLHPIPTALHESEMARLLESQLYGWVRGPKYKSVSSLAQSFRNGGQGIVITTGDHYFRFAAHLIKSLQMFNCTLPIEIWYNGPKDLNATKIEFLKRLAPTKIQIKDIQSYFQVKMETWDIKPFAMLASSFEQVMLLDADTVFMKDPSTLFKDPAYQRDGALFFKDRSLFPGQGDKSNWVLSLFPEPHSQRIRNLRILQARSQYELESGVVIIDKRRHFHGILATGLLNCPGPVKDMIREQTYGEKETFWIGLEMLDEPWSFMPHLPGTLGTICHNEKDNVDELCGKLAHFDRQGKLLWFNDGIAASKLPNDFFLSEVTDLTHYARESECIWENLCLRNGPFHNLTSSEQGVIEDLKGLYKDNDIWGLGDAEIEARALIKADQDGTRITSS